MEEFPRLERRLENVADRLSRRLPAATARQTPASHDESARLMELDEDGGGMLRRNPLLRGKKTPVEERKDMLPRGSASEAAGQETRVLEHVFSIRCSHRSVDT